MHWKRTLVSSGRREGKTEEMRLANARMLKARLILDICGGQEYKDVAALRREAIELRERVKRMGDRARLIELREQDVKRSWERFWRHRDLTRRLLRRRLDPRRLP